LVSTQPGVTSTILGASRPAQLESNLRAIEFSIPAELRKRLDEVIAPESVHPYVFFEPFIQGMINGGSSVRGWTPAGVRAERIVDSSRKAPESGSESSESRSGEFRSGQRQKVS
jgi:hypothetical protein